MTRLPVPQVLPHRPSSVALGELAIAAGQAGYCVTLCYKDFPPPLLCDLWRYYTRGLAAPHVLQVFGQRDLRQIGARAGRLHLVLIHATRLCDAVGWTIGMAQAREESRCPAIFVRSMPSDAEEPPGASLVLRAQPAESESIARWLAAGGGPGNAWAAIEPPSEVEYDPAIASILAPPASGGGGVLLPYGDRRLVQGLVLGAAILRTSRTGQTDGPLRVSVEDYEEVRRLLQSEVVCRNDDQRDPLAVAMVARANVYLTIGSGRNQAAAGGRDDDRNQPSGVCKQLITRREVADLGNTRSRTVRRLVEHLRHAPSGYERFRRLGLLGHPPGEPVWRSCSIDALLAALRPWSLKQVRTHFGRLQRDGFLTAVRDRGNGPWRYRLPEELATSSSPFRSLPRIERMAAGQVPA